MPDDPTPALTSNVQHIWCNAEISQKMADVFVGFVLNQAQSGAGISEYVVYLSTLGGSPFSAINLYDFIKSIPQKTTVYNMGSVYSAGVPFFLSFDNRIGVPDCSFLIHQTTLPRTELPERFNVFDLETQKTILASIDEKTHKLIQKEISGRGSKNLSAAAIKKAALNTTVYQATDAVKYGFIDKIEMPKLPDTGVLYITDQYLATLPG